jgi:hypothetical protein
MWEECPICRVNYKLTDKGVFRKHKRHVCWRGYYSVKEICPGSGKTPNKVLHTDAAIPPSAEPLSGSIIVPAVESDSQPRW